MWILRLGGLRPRALIACEHWPTAAGNGRISSLDIYDTECQNRFQHSAGTRGRLMASTREWFETVEEARRRARRRLPRSVYMALVAGTEKGVTLRDNTDAFSELRFAPPRIAC